MTFYYPFGFLKYIKNKNSNIIMRFILEKIFTKNFIGKIIIFASLIYCGEEEMDAMVSESSENGQLSGNLTNPKNYTEVKKNFTIFTEWTMVSSDKNQEKQAKNEKSVVEVFEKIFLVLKNFDGFRTFIKNNKPQKNNFYDVLEDLLDFDVTSSEGKEKIMSFLKNDYITDEKIRETPIGSTFFLKLYSNFISDLNLKFIIEKTKTNEQVQKTNLFSELLGFECVLQRKQDDEEPTSQSILDYGDNNSIIIDSDVFYVQKSIFTSFFTENITCEKLHYKFSITNFPKYMVKEYKYSLKKALNTFLVGENTFKNLFNYRFEYKIIGFVWSNLKTQNFDYLDILNGIYYAQNSSNSKIHEVYQTLKSDDEHFHMNVIFILEKLHSEENI